jgi:hypothetical protein
VALDLLVVPAGNLPHCILRSFALILRTGTSGVEHNRLIAAVCSTEMFQKPIYLVRSPSAPDHARRWSDQSIKVVLQRSAAAPESQVLLAGPTADLGSGRVRRPVPDGPAAVRAAAHAQVSARAVASAQTRQPRDRDPARSPLVAVGAPERVAPPVGPVFESVRIHVFE